MPCSYGVLRPHEKYLCLVAANYTGFVRCFIVFAHCDCCGVLLGSIDLGVALNLGIALDGTSGVFRGVAFAYCDSSGISLAGIDAGVALDLNTGFAAGLNTLVATLGLVGESRSSNESRSNE